MDYVITNVFSNVFTFLIGKRFRNCSSRKHRTAIIIFVCYAYVNSNGCSLSLSEIAKFVLFIFGVVNIIMKSTMMVFFRCILCVMFTKWFSSMDHFFSTRDWSYSKFLHFFQMVCLLFHVSWWCLNKQLIGIFCQMTEFFHVFFSFFLCFTFVWSLFSDFSSNWHSFRESVYIDFEFMVKKDFDRKSAKSNTPKFSGSELMETIRIESDRIGNNI